MMSFDHRTPRMPKNRVRQICTAFLPALKPKPEIAARETDALREKRHSEYTCVRTAFRDQNGCVKTFTSPCRRG